jgi:hypothetical protein
VGVRRASPVSEAMSARRRSAVGRGRSARRLGVLEKKVQLFFLHATRGDKRLVHPCVGPGRVLDQELLGEPSPSRCVSGFSTAGSKYLSIVRRARMLSTGDDKFYTSSGLRGVIPYVQCVATVFLSQVCL